MTMTRATADAEVAACRLGSKTKPSKWYGQPMAQDLAHIDVFLLKVLYNAQFEGRDLNDAGTEARRREDVDLDLDAYGRAIERLRDRQLVESNILLSGDGHIASVYVRRVTGPGAQAAAAAD
jgi:hypothetical protein